MNRLFEVKTEKGNFFVFPSEMKRLAKALDMFSKAEEMRMRPVNRTSFPCTMGEAMLNGFSFGAKSLSRFTLSQLAYIQKIVKLEERATYILDNFSGFKSTEERLNYIKDEKARREERKYQALRK